MTCIKLSQGSHINNVTFITLETCIKKDRPYYANKIGLMSHNEKENNINNNNKKCRARGTWLDAFEAHLNEI